MTNHLETNQLTQDTLDRQLLESLAFKQRPKTKADRQKSRYYVLTGLSFFCQLISFVLASSGVLFQLVTNFKSSTGWILILLSVAFLALNEVFVYIMLKSFHSERLDDKSINKSTVLMLACSFCVSTPLTYFYTPYAVSLFASAPTYVDTDSVGIAIDILIASDTSYWANMEAKALADMREIKSTKGSYYRGTMIKEWRALMKSNEETARAARSRLNELLLEGNDNKSVMLADAKLDNEIIKQTHEQFCASFGGWLALVTVGAMVLLFGARWYCETWKRLYVIEGNIKLKEQDKPQSQRVEVVKEKPFKVKEVLKDTEKQVLSPIGFNSKDTTFSHKEGDVLKGKAPKVDRVFVLKGDGNLKAYTLGGLNNLIKVSSDSRKQHLEQLRNKLL